MSNKDNQQTTRDWSKALKLFYIVSSWVIGPIILAILVGSWLDDKYQTSPIFSLTLIAIAFIMTCVGIVREALKAIKDLK